MMAAGGEVNVNGNSGAFKMLGPFVLWLNM